VSEKGDATVRAVHTQQAPKPVGPYSQGVVAGGLLFTAGQVGLVPATGKLVGPDAASQARQALDNLAAVLSAAGASMRDVVKTTIYLLTMEDFAAVNAVYGERFDGPPPARSTVAVSSLPVGARVEIDMIVRLP
jgi:2-iminobutanoate/2-iminopropanoate deaminase